MEVSVKARTSPDVQVSDKMWTECQLLKFGIARAEMSEDYIDALVRLVVKKQTIDKDEIKCMRDRLLLHAAE